MHLMVNVIAKEKGKRSDSVLGENPILSENEKAKWKHKDAT